MKKTLISSVIAFALMAPAVAFAGGGPIEPDEAPKTQQDLYYAGPTDQVKSQTQVVTQDLSCVGPTVDKKPKKMRPAGDNRTVMINVGGQWVKAVME